MSWVEPGSRIVAAATGGTSTLRAETAVRSHGVKVYGSDRSANVSKYRPVYPIAGSGSK